MRMSKRVPLLATICCSQAGAVVGTVAAGSALKKTADAIPAVKEVLKTVFVDNGKLVGSGAALAASALLAEDAVAAYKEGNTGRAVAEGNRGCNPWLGRRRKLTGRQFDIPVLNRALSGPAEATAKFLVTRRRFGRWRCGSRWGCPGQKVVSMTSKRASISKPQANWQAAA